MRSLHCSVYALHSPVDDAVTIAINIHKEVAQSLLIRGNQACWVQQYCSLMRQQWALCL